MKVTCVFTITLLLLSMFMFTLSFTPCLAAGTVATHSNLIDWDGALLWFNVTFPNEWVVKHNYTVTFNFRLVTLKGNDALRLIKLHTSVSGTEISNSTPILKELRVGEVYSISLSFWAKDFSFSAIPAGSSKLVKLNVDLYGEVDRTIGKVTYTYPRNSRFSFNLQIRSPAAPIILSYNAPSSVDLNALFDINLSLLNGGEYFIRDVKVQAFPPREFQLRSVDVLEADVINVNESRVFTFKFIALSPGLRSVKFTVSYVSYGDYEVKKDLTIQVRAKSLSSIVCSYSPKKPTVFSPVNITGAINPKRQSEVKILVVNPQNVNATLTAKTDAEGAFKASFTPDLIGVWRVVVSWPGDNEYSAAQTELSFDVGKGMVNVFLTITPETPKIGDDIVVSGKLSVPIDATISLLIASPTGSSSKISVQVSKGSFTYTFKVEEAGTWVVDVSWPGDENFQGFRRTQTFDVYTPEAGFLLGLSATSLLIVASVVVVIIAIMLIILRRR